MITIAMWIFFFITPPPSWAGAPVRTETDVGAYAFAAVILGWTACPWAPLPEAYAFAAIVLGWVGCPWLPLPGTRKLEQVKSHMAQVPVLRVKVGARALRVRSVSKEGAWASAGVQVQDAWVSGCGCEAARLRLPVVPFLVGY